MTIAQQLGRLNASVEMATKAKEFCTLARIVALSHGDHALAQHIAEKSRLSPTIAVFSRAARRSTPSSRMMPLGKKQLLLQVPQQTQVGRRLLPSTKFWRGLFLKA